MLPLKTMLTVGTFSVLMALPSLIPALQQFQAMRPAAMVIAKIPEVWNLPVPLSMDSGASKMDEIRSARATMLAGEHLMDPTHEMDHFYDALLKGGTVRVTHYGDSPTTADMITADARAMLQKQFGDAGAGFLLIAKPWAWYQHRGVTMDATKWNIDVAGVAELKDGLYGLGGGRFRGSAGSVANWTIKDGQQASVEVAFQARPEGGSFAFDADGQEVGKASTAAEDIHPGYVTFSIPLSATQFRLRVDSGDVQLFGVEFRKNRAGIIYSSLGINGANVTMMSRIFDKAHITTQLRHYKPDLVVLAYGTNESGYPSFVDKNWASEMEAAVKRVRAALPDSSILLMSPMDRGEAKSDGSIGTIEALPRLIAKEKHVAEQQNVAFFNTFEAMGGAGTMARWAKSEPRKVGFDYIHPMAPGAKVVGELLYRALGDGYEHYRRRQPTGQDVRPSTLTPSASAQPADTKLVGELKRK